MTNLNRWSPWYATAEVQRPYGDEAAYRKAEEWLAGLPVEDWGCGYAWFKRYHNGPYRGVDGTPSRWNDIWADLENYRSSGWNILLRHVLEHNYNWWSVLSNAVESFDKRLCIILFTPTGETKILAENVGGLGVPDLGFRIEDITDAFDESIDYIVDTFPADSGYDNIETIIKAERLVK
jgi:hypothetical protein